MVAVVAIAAHHQVAWNGFINLDDQLYVTGNSRVQDGLSVANAWWALTTFDAYNWHPLVWLSHMLDVQLWGMEASRHHITSLLLHAANSIVLFLFLRRATGASYRSWVVAAIFAAHPLHVESIAWIAERKDVLSAHFFLLALLVYAGGSAKHSIPRTVGSLALFAAALMAKPMAVTLPLLLLLLDWWPLRRITAAGASPATAARAWIRAVLAKSPYFGLSAGCALLTLIAQNKGGTGTILYESSIWLNAQNALVSYARYLGKTFWPTNLAIIYPFRRADLTSSIVTTAALLLCAITASAWLLRRSRPHILFGWIWFLVTLLPVIGFLRFGRHAIADRYTYLPLIGIYVIVVWTAVELWDRASLPRNGSLAVAASVVALLGVLSVQQEIRWRSSITLFEHTLRVTQHNAVAHINLGIAYAAIGNFAAAEREGATGRLIEAHDVVDLNPLHPLAHYRLGNAYMEMRRHAEAVQAFREAVRLQPAFTRAYNNLGVSLAELGRFDEATQAFYDMLRVDPSSDIARQNIEKLQQLRRQSASDRSLGQP